MFNSFPQSVFEIVSPEGIVRSKAKGICDGQVITVPDKMLVIQVGDEMRRRLPNGTDETFEVVNPNFFDKFHGIPAHFQVSVRRKGTFPQGSGGNYSLNVSGANSRINIGSHDASTNVSGNENVFGNLVEALKQAIQNEAERDALIATVGQMERAKGGTGFVAAYQKFVGLAADHLGVITPFLPAISQFLER